MRISKHTEEQATKKNIPLAVVFMVAHKKCDTNMVRTLHGDKCPRCSCEKQEWTGYGQFQGKRFGVSVVVCVRCDSTRTTYKAPTHGRTPIRDDQWEKGQREYRACCDDCGKRFTVKARTWEDLRKETNHRCRGNKLVNLIADEHKHLKGKDFPKELFGD